MKSVMSLFWVEKNDMPLNALTRPEESVCSRFLFYFGSCLIGVIGSSKSIDSMRSMSTACDVMICSVGWASIEYYLERM